MSERGSGWNGDNFDACRNSRARPAIILSRRPSNNRKVPMSRWRQTRFLRGRILISRNSSPRGNGMRGTPGNCVVKNGKIYLAERSPRGTHASSNLSRVLTRRPLRRGILAESRGGCDYYITPRTSAHACDSCAYSTRIVSARTCSRVMCAIAPPSITTRAVRLAWLRFYFWFSRDTAHTEVKSASSRARDTDLRFFARN